MTATTNINWLASKTANGNEKFVVVDTDDTLANPKTKLVESSEISKTWHTHTASEITDFDTEVSNNATVAANTSKLSGIEAGADVTDATNVDAAGAVMNSDTTTASMAFVIDEDNMASDSPTKVPTQQSVKAYVDATDRWFATAERSTQLSISVSDTFVISHSLGSIPTFVRVYSQQRNDTWTWWDYSEIAIWNYDWSTNRSIANWPGWGSWWDWLSSTYCIPWWQFSITAMTTTNITITAWAAVTQADSDEIYALFEFFG